MQLTTQTSQAVKRIRTVHIAALGGLLVATTVAAGIAVSTSQPATYEAPAPAEAFAGTDPVFTELERALWYQPAPREAAVPGTMSGADPAAAEIDSALWFQPAPTESVVPGTFTGTDPAITAIESALWFQPVPAEYDAAATGAGSGTAPALGEIDAALWFQPVPGEPAVTTGPVVVTPGMIQEYEEAGR
jgi:hypothetical protein